MTPDRVPVGVALATALLVSAAMWGVLGVAGAVLVRWAT